MDRPSLQPLPSRLMTSRGFLNSDDERIYFESWGDGGEAIVFNHGMGGHHAVWYQQVAAFAEHYRVVTWDQRGFGRSTSNGVIGPKPAVGDLERLLNKLEIDRTHIVGQSMGGWSALGFAIKHPHRTSSLVLADTTGGIFTAEIRRTLDEYGQGVASGPPPDAWPLGYHPAVGSQLQDESIAQSFLYGQLGSLTDPPPPTDIIGLLMGTDHTEKAKEVATRTLFIGGENDPIFPPALIKSAARFIRNSEVAAVTDTGHSPYFERPDAWNDIVLTFLRHSSS